MSDTPPENDPNSLLDTSRKISDKISRLFETNQRLSMLMRQQAVSFDEIAVVYQQQMNSALDIRDAILSLSVDTAEHAADIIAGEFGLAFLVAPEEDEEDEEDVE